MRNKIGPVVFEYLEKWYTGYLTPSKGKNVRIKICYGTLVFAIPENIIRNYHRSESVKNGKLLEMFNRSEDQIDYSGLFCVYMKKLNMDRFLVKKKIVLSGVLNMTDEFVYILGEKKKVIYGSTMANEGEFSIGNKSDLNSLYREMALGYLKKRTQELSEVMRVVKPVTVGLSNATNYLGMNNIRLNKIIYNPTLYSFSTELIDAIIIHELAHCFVHGHNKEFYAIIHTYCPRYKEYSTYISGGMYNLEMVSEYE